MTASEAGKTPMLLLGAALLAAAVLSAIYFAAPVGAALAGSTAVYDAERLLLVYSSLPRATIALLGGAGLALSGAILQQVLRNPIASPETVGISAGARLALAISSAFFPSLLGFGRDLVAFAGAAISTGIVLLVSRRRQYSPLSLIITGLLVSMYCGALATVLVLVKDRYLVSLFIWGSGSLSQLSWQPTLDLTLRLGVASTVLALLVRPLSLMELGDDTARGLGVPVERMRVIAVALAVILAASVTSAVGMIGFVGLAGPAIARLSGARRFSTRLLYSAVFGALLLLITDLAVLIVAAESAAFLPTGAVTAILGSPLLLLLLPRLRGVVSGRLPGDGTMSTLEQRRTSERFLPCVVATVMLLTGLLLLVGRLPDGAWSLAHWASLEQVLSWRVPRLLCAAGAGGLLAMAGFVLQRVSANPMASPEVMGVSAGAILGVAVTSFLFPAMTSPLGIYGAAALGALIALLCVMAFAVRSSFTPERLLLAGIALTALVDAVIGLLTATGDPRAVMLLSWLSGSTNGASLSLGLIAIIAMVALSALALLGSRWLTILPMGVVTARSIGVPAVMAQSLYLLLVALVAAIATPIIGPLSFIGLVAPHFVHALGNFTAQQGLLLSAGVGAVTMAVADTLARTIAFPLQLPTGLMSMLVLGPFLVYLMARRVDYTDVGRGAGG
mgnify:CR=1 FL=1|tara:strand:+ start:9867 stop:11888 length:2022 start_codon:yes stop_codon:yes gene_type:complete